MPLAEKGVRGKGRQPLSPPQLTLAPEREQRSGSLFGQCGLVRSCRLQFCESGGRFLHRTVTTFQPPYNRLAKRMDQHHGRK